MSIDKTPTTAKPEGLKCKRSYTNLTASWKCGSDNYGAGQDMRWRIWTTNKTHKAWHDISIKTKTTVVTFEIPVENYYPTNGKSQNIYAIEVQVRGRRAKYKVKEKYKVAKKENGKVKKDKNGKTVYETKERDVTITPNWSAWTTKKYIVRKPRQPKVTAALDDVQEYTANFAWESDWSTTERKWHRSYKWDAIRLKDSNITNGAKAFARKDAADKKSGTSIKADNEDIREDSLVIADGHSYTRWFKVVSRGPRGDSKASYAKHVYGSPNMAAINTAEVYSTEAGGLECYVKWKADRSGSKPIRDVVVQYAIEPPESGMSCPDGADWKIGRTVGDTNGYDAARFSIDGVISLDKCLFVRVNTLWDTETNTTYGIPYLAKNGTGYLTDPSSVGVEPDPSQHTAEVSATNGSAVDDAILVVVIRSKADTDKQESDQIVGYIERGEDSVIVQYPEQPDGGIPAFGVYAAVFDEDGEIVMRSRNTVWRGGVVPTAPQNVAVVPATTQGTVLVTWEKNWDEATGTILSWSDNPEAWESTEEPNEYEISQLRASRWNVGGLETGKRWYFRLRHIKRAGEAVTYGPWSAIEYLDLLSKPSKPSLQLSASVITPDGNVEASWSYSNADGTAQGYAEICEANIVSGVIQYGKVIREVSGAAQSVILEAAADEIQWEAGHTYLLCVRVSSSAGEKSDKWSDPVAIKVAEPLVAGIGTTSLEQYSNNISHGEYTYDWAATAGEVDAFDVDMYLLSEALENDAITAFVLSRASDVWSIAVNGGAVEEITGPDDYGITISASDDDLAVSVSNIVKVSAPEFETELSLRDMPLSVQVTGAGDYDAARVVIERAEDYPMRRPDESTRNGFEGETIAIKEIEEGNDTAKIALSDLIGPLDDGAAYRIIATISDADGQSDDEELEFTVHWKQQAVKPLARVEMQGTAALLTPEKPAGWAQGDTCDIYRLSADKPELIYQNAIFDETYVDPYPALGPHGGHRFVYKTVNGDYITKFDEIAWLDTGEEDGDRLNLEGSLIDFDGRQILLSHNVDVSHKWQKDFVETRYLGGHVQGDWNAAVGRSASMSAVVINASDEDEILALRRLAAYNGICHLRTQDGSSFACDIQVSEDRNHDKYGMVTSFSFEITRVDPEGYDGVTEEQWEA